LAIVPLKLYYSATRQNNFTTTTSKGNGSAERGGYDFVRNEGYLFNATLLVDKYLILSTVNRNNVFS
jgi:hypothetical protein